MGTPNGVPDWLKEGEGVQLRIRPHRRKGDPLTELVTVVRVIRAYNAKVRTADGIEKVVHLKDLARFPREEPVPNEATEETDLRDDLPIPIPVAEPAEPDDDGVYENIPLILDDGEPAEVLPEGPALPPPPGFEGPEQEQLRSAKRSGLRDTVTAPERLEYKVYKQLRNPVISPRRRTGK